MTTHTSTNLRSIRGIQIQGRGLDVFRTSSLQIETLSAASLWCWRRIFSQNQSVRTGINNILQDNLSQWRAAMLITPRSTTCAGHHSLREERFVCSHTLLLLPTINSDLPLPRESGEVVQNKVSLNSVKPRLFFRVRHLFECTYKGMRYLILIVPSNHTPTCVLFGLC